MKRRLLWVAAAVASVAGVAFVAVAGGLVPIAASSGHWAATSWFLHFAMQRSVATHSLGIDPPPLDDERLVLLGAGHYDGGCRPCHGAPGHRAPRVPLAMTPHPPDLANVADEYDAAELFYIVRHGVKFTGMPAWPADGRDDEVWSVVAFLIELPKLDGASYSKLVAGSDTEAEDTAASRGREHRPVGDAQPPAVVRASCGRCHGTDGRGRGLGAFPRLAGQNRAYLASSLRAYIDGKRPSGIMVPIAAKLGDSELDAVASWYAEREPAARHGKPDARGAQLAARGVPERRVAACDGCHGRGERLEAYPLLRGQYAEYLKQQLELFSKGQRGGTAYAELMEASNPHALEPEEILAVVRHYAGLEP